VDKFGKLLDVMEQSDVTTVAEVLDHGVGVQAEQVNNTDERALSVSSTWCLCHDWSEADQLYYSCKSRRRRALQKCQVDGVTPFCGDESTNQAQATLYDTLGASGATATYCSTDTTNSLGNCEVCRRPPRLRRRHPHRRC
jgi:hypothetical protein